MRTGDAVERASRLLASAYGYGDSWIGVDCQFNDDKVEYGDGVATDRRGDGYSVARRTETLERACRPAGIREFHHWQRAKGIAVMPRSGPKRGALIALADAHLEGPLEDWLRVYALQEWSRWPAVRRYALLVRPDPPAVQDAAERVLFGLARQSQEARARELAIRHSAYRTRTQAAERMLREWLDRAAHRVLAASMGDCTT